MTIAVSSWALHLTIGASYPDNPETGPKEAQKHSASTLAIEELPQELRRRGYDRAELCHFHLPGTNPARLSEIRRAFEAECVTVQSLLIDDGDLSDAANGRRDAEWIGKWIDAAAALGAERARIIAGKTPYSQASFARALPHIRALAERAETRGVRLTTENWFPLMATPEAVLNLLDCTEGKVGLCADFGNWSGDGKYADLASIFPRAETCHAKCDFLDAETIDMDDYSRCMKTAVSSGFSGPFVIVNGGPSDEWRAIELTAAAIQAS